MRNIATIFLLLLCAVLLCLVMEPVFKSGGRQHVAPVNLHLLDSAKYWKDKYGNEHATFEQHVIKTNAEREQYRDSVTELARLLKVKPKQIEGNTRIAFNISEIATGTVKRDSADGSLSFGHTSQFWDFSAYIDSLGHYTVRDTMFANIDLVPYWQRRHQFLGIRYGRIDHFNDITSANPAVKITGASTYKVKTKEPGRFGLGPYVGYTVAGQWSAGISLHYSIIRF